ncbi:MAG TPA: histidine--tRNA ligase [Caldisericia bacterium]|nr:histidine--tRNA ligase [Caldisericia bacterium]HXK51433.1 histidine--tRNA ligase [Caldisericia bacterium]
MKYKRVKGTRDILPQEWILRESIINIVKNTAYAFGYGEMTTPILEEAGLFIHSVGDSSDIVTKEMYTLVDKAGRNLVLIPEGTAGICRAFLEAKMTVWPKPVKVFYLQRLFRYEQPQKGRYREFSQFGVECFGSKSPSSDAEMISLAHTILKKLHFSSLSLHINTLGCDQCRKEYREALIRYFQSFESSLCEDCRVRLKTNPLRILDCKKPECKNCVAQAPKIQPYLCDDCKEHFQSVLETIDTLEIPYVVDHELVRGLDYYTQTVFEFISRDLGAQGTVLGGGRYDGLLEKELDGPSMPAIGFAMGLERITMLLETKRSELELRDVDPMLYIANFGGTTAAQSLQIAQDLRYHGINVLVDFEGKGMKKVFETAEKRNAKYLIVIGEEEEKTGIVSIRNLQTRQNKELDFESITTYFLKGDLNEF